MENLRTDAVKTDNAEGTEEFVLQEKANGDTVVYDIYRKGHYLMTLSNEGNILFMNRGISGLNDFIEKIASIFLKKMMLA